MKNSRDCLVVVETWIDGKLARVEIEADESVRYSKQARAAVEITARASFAALSDKFNPKQKIRVVEILILKPAGEGH